MLITHLPEKRSYEMKTAKAAVMVGVNEPFAVREFPLVPAPAGMAKIKLEAVASGSEFFLEANKSKAGFA